MTSKTALFNLVHLYIIIEQIVAVVPSTFIVLFDGLAFSDYALFNPNYGKWGDVWSLPG